MLYVVSVILSCGHGFSTTRRVACRPPPPWSTSTSRRSVPLSTNYPMVRQLLHVASCIPNIVCSITCKCSCNDVMTAALTIGYAVLSYTQRLQYSRCLVWRFTRTLALSRRQVVCQVSNTSQMYITVNFRHWCSCESLRYSFKMYIHVLFLPQNNAWQSFKKILKTNLTTII